ncbi:4-amino-4-deoxy-L-arabinose transferase (plasmid) [Cupriavidus necator]|uniref:EamA family transporter n=1 Tax=Cupriavidus TaxID=106589 RepID=UPI000E2EF91C|nr:EamA family transporter [Cupriavidus sp. P-10]
MALSSFAFLFAGVLCNAAAQLLLKAGVSTVGAIPLERAALVNALLQVLIQWQVVAGLALYGIGVVVWIVGLSRIEVSVAYPMLSVGYVLNAMAASWLLGEMIGPMRVAGMLLILGGVLLVARS